MLYNDKQLLVGILAQNFGRQVKEIVSLKTKIKVMKFETLNIKSLTRETEDAVSIRLDVPKELKSDWSFKAGQYVTVEIMKNGKTVRRSYSLSSAPQSGQWTFTVKRVPGGLMSTYLVNELQLSDQLKVSKPEGRFVVDWDADKGKNYFVIAAGSGITPLYSIIKNGLEAEPLSQFHLMYGNRNEEQTIFLEDLQELQLKYDQQLSVHFAFSQILAGPPFHPDNLFSQGRISIDYLDVWYQHYNDHDRPTKILVCGPGPLIESVVAWAEAHVDKKEVLVEYFSSPESDDVLNGAKPAATSEEESLLRLKFPTGNTLECVINRNNTILEELLEQGIDAPYSCQAGICTSCVVRKKSGDVQMQDALALDDDDIAEGLILLCQSRAVSEEIELEVE